MTGQIDKGMVFIAASTDNTHHTSSAGPYNTIILTIASGTGQFINTLGLFPTPFLI